MTTERAAVSPFARRVTLPAQALIHAEVSAGVMLLIGATVGLLAANSAWRDAVERALAAPLAIDLAGFRIEKSFRHWVNDGLMTLFFFVIGLEIKREVHDGDLSTRSRAALPIVAALGGMILPVLMYAAMTAGGSGVRGWPVPMATDIAFALGVLALVGPRVPSSLKVFLLAFAAADDVGGVIVIATVYTHDLSMKALMAAAVILGGIFALKAVRVRALGAYFLAGGLFWFAVLRSGIHPTIAGVILGILAPAGPPFEASHYPSRARELLSTYEAVRAAGDREYADSLLGQLEELTNQTDPPAERLDRMLRPWVTYLVLPLFAATSAAIPIERGSIEVARSSPVALAIVLALVVGKPLGILASVWLATRTSAVTLPANVTWRHIVGTALLAGMGFTVSLFIAELAFGDSEQDGIARLAILIASAIAGCAGYLYLRLALPPAELSRNDVETAEALACGVRLASSAAMRDRPGVSSSRTP